VLEIRYIGDPGKGLPDEGGPAPAAVGAGEGPAAGRAAEPRVRADLHLRHPAGRTAGLAHRDEPGVPQFASLDHAVWFHRPFRADEWLLFDMDSPSYAYTGLARGQFFSQDGGWWPR